MRYGNYVRFLSFPLLLAVWKVVVTFSVVVQLAMAKDPEGAFFKRLEGLQPCEVSELKPGTHIFAVYGLNNLFCFIVLLFATDVFSCELIQVDIVQEITSLRLLAIQLKQYVQSHMKIPPKNLRTLRLKF
jgi:hypothetical protein